MKKILSVIVLLLMLFSLAACAGGGENPTQPTQTKEIVDENGNKTRSEVYSKGKLEWYTLYEYYENGTLKKQSTYKVHKEKDILASSAEYKYFENGKISMGYELKSTNSSLYVTTQHGRKCAYLRTYSDGADSITFTPTVMAEENYNTVVFDTMIQLGHKGPSTTYYQNYALTDVNGNVAYKFTLRHGDAGMQFNDGTNNEQLLIAPKDTWFNLRIEYTYIDENTVTVNTYVDNTLKFSSTNYFVGETAIKDVCVFKHTTDSGIGAAVFYDDVSFKQIYVAPTN